jgi:hypothetical protein
MGLFDMTFWGVGLPALQMAWPAFVLSAGAQVVAVRRVRRLGAPRLVLTVPVVVLALSALAALAVGAARVELEWAAREGLPYPGIWARTVEIVTVSTGPTLWVSVLGQAALIRRPRSVWVETVLVVVTGTALSWALAIWLALQWLPEWMHDSFRLPGAFGAVASLGFVLSGGLWASVIRWRSPRP